MYSGKIADLMLTWYVVKLGDDTMPVVGSCKAVVLMYFWAEMAEKKDSWLVWADEDGANENFKVFRHFLASEIEFRTSSLS